MNNATKVLLCLLLFAVPLKAQAPTDFAGWTARATELLNHPGEGENDIRRKWDQGTKAAEAGKAFMEAAKLAPDDATRFKMLDSAGAAFYKGHGMGKEAAEAYGMARDMTSIDPKERGRVGLAAAKASEQITDYEKVVAITGASDDHKSKAYAAIGVKSSVAKDYRKAAESYEIASRLDKTQANVWLGIASVNAQKIIPAKDAEAMLDRVYKTWIAWMEGSDRTADDKANSRPYYLQNWARDLKAIGASNRAIALWQEAANSPKASEQIRYDSLKNAATEAHNTKNYDLALQLWEKTGQVSPNAYVRAQEAALGRGNAQLGKGDYSKARAELAALMAHPQAGAREKEGLLLTQSSLFFDEADALAKKNAPATQIAEKEVGGRKILDDLWAVSTASDAALLQVALSKVSRDLQKKEYTAAHDFVKGGIEKFTARGFGTEWLQQLHVLNGDIYRGEKQYANAMISYSTGIIQHGLGGTALVPNQPIYSAALGMLSEATTAGNFAEARKVVEWLDKWQVPVDPTVLFKIELEIKAGNKEAARGLITKNKALIFQEESKKKLAELEAQLA